MNGRFLRAVRTGSIVVAVAGGTLLLSQAVAMIVVVRVLGSVVQQVLG